MDDERQSTRDLYQRRPTSTSRGRTHERIMALQHAPHTLPGAEEALAIRPPGSIAAAICDFHAAWATPRRVTTRRSYERSLALLSRDLHANGPDPAQPLQSLAGERLGTHIEWRVAVGLTDPGELQRAALHLARLCEWLDAERDGSFGAIRPVLRERAAAALRGAPPPYHAAGSASELRDTSGDARVLGLDEAEPG